jgi:hypothetical protein
MYPRFALTPPGTLRPQAARRWIRAIEFATAFALFAFVQAEELPALSPSQRRLFDATPVSAGNPVVAEIKECAIEIPLSELQAYVRTDTPPTKVGQTLTAEEKRAELQKLLNEHLWVWAGYHAHADQDRDILGMLHITEVEGMRALLVRDEIESKAKSFAEYQLLKKAFVQRLFDQAEIHISPAAYALLKPAAKRLNAAEASLRPTQELDPNNLPDGLTQEQRLMPLATCKVATVRIGDFLAAYSRKPVPERANLDNQAALVSGLQDALEGALLLAEARARGLDRAPEVQHQVENDRTGLVRQWAIEEVARRADVEVHQPQSEPRIKSWYDAHRADLYTTKDAAGKPHVLDYAENHDEVMNDYFTHRMEEMRQEQLAAYRKGRTILVNEQPLESATVRWLEPPAKLEMPASKISWDGDTREYVVKPGETHVTFVFTLTNVSTDLLTIDDVHPMNEFVTVDGPAFPWRVAAGQHAEVRLTVDLRGKVGVGKAPIEVESSVGSKTLTLTITYPSKPVADTAGTHSGSSAHPM